MRRTTPTDRPPRAAPRRVLAAVLLPVLVVAACVSLSGCASAPRDGPPQLVWVRAELPALLRSSPDGPELRGYEVVPYLGWEPVLKFTRDHPESGSLIYVARETRYDEHGVPRTFGRKPQPAAYAPTGETVGNADGVWQAHVRTSARE